MAPLPIVTLVLGGWDLATHADLMLQGLLFAQFTHYWTQYRSDHLPIKLFVVGLCIATTVKSAHAIALVWMQNVEYFMDPERGDYILVPSPRRRTPPACCSDHNIRAILLPAPPLLSRQTYYVFCLALLFVFSVIAAIVTIAYSLSGTSTNDNGSLHFTSKNAWIAVAIQSATVVAGDVLLCGSTLYFLVTHFPRRREILHRLMRLTFQSAAPGALCASLMLICDLYYNIRGSLDAGLPLLVISSMITPKLYAISAMWTLNSRRGLRSHFPTVVASTDPGKLNSGAEMTMIRFQSRGGDLPPLQTDIEMLAETVESAEHVEHGPRRRLSV
ncbi:hypothetical protein C8J57DRAFT_1544003 [Mycena rebaudengoi]|nr:hypothetical protein C8J57DRAFT_1544003 [Mycena rebaudengoi]